MHIPALPWKLAGGLWANHTFFAYSTSEGCREGKMKKGRLLSTPLNPHWGEKWGIHEVINR